MLSGDMADILSNLYLAKAVEFYQETNESSFILTNYVRTNNDIHYNFGMMDVRRMCSVIYYDGLRR